MFVQNRLFYFFFLFCFDEPRIKLSNPFFVFCVERLQAWRLPNFLQIFRYHQCYQIAGLIHFSCLFWCLWNVILCWLREILMTHLSTVEIALNEIMLARQRRWFHVQGAQMKCFITWEYICANPQVRCCSGNILT